MTGKIRITLQKRMALDANFDLAFKQILTSQDVRSDFAVRDERPVLPIIFRYDHQKLWLGPIGKFDCQPQNAARDELLENVLSALPWREGIADAHHQFARR